MIVDLFLVFQFIKRLGTPFNEWPAFKLGIIDEKGNQLIKRADFTKRDQKDAFGIFDIMITKLKRLLEKVPGGATRIGSYAAALYLIKEHDEIQSQGEIITEEQLEKKLAHYISYASTSNIDSLFESYVNEGARIARKPGQAADSTKHSDLYTDENPKDTITGLKFATVEDAKASVNKIRDSGRSHAHKIQAAVAMEQRARVAGKTDAAAVYRSYIDDNKKTKNEDAPANSAGSGNIAGIGVGPDGEPGVTPKAMSKYKKSGKVLKRFKDTIPLMNNKG